MVLITGASGFLGQHLVRFLSSKNKQIRALYFNHYPNGDIINQPGVEWVKADLLDVYAVEEAMAGVTDVYHCAAIVSFDAKDRKRLLHFNIESTKNIVNQALLQGIRKLVYVSSVAAIGRSGVKGKEITEEEEWGESEHNTAYGLSKYLAETEVWRGIGEGLNAVIVNPGIILGKGDWNRGSSQLMQVASKEFPFYTNGVNSWVDVDDVVEVMYRLMSSNISSERFIISSDNFAYKDIFTMMAKAINKKPPSIRANKIMTSVAWRMSCLNSWLTGKKSLITQETATTAQGLSFYDNKKFLSAFPGFNYQHIEVTIGKMATSFLAKP